MYFTWKVLPPSPTNSRTSSNTGPPSFKTISPIEKLITPPSVLLCTPTTLGISSVIRWRKFFLKSYYMPCMRGFVFSLKEFISWGSEHTDLKYGICARVCVLSRIQLPVTPWTGSPPGSSIQGILQSRILKWVVILFSKGFAQPRDQTHISISPTLADRFLTTASPEKPLNYGILVYLTC